MSQSRLYQPLLLRLLHGVNAAIALLAILSAFVVYNTYDGRLGKVPVPRIADIIGIHGTFGKMLLLGVMPTFALYSFHAGQKRLVQPDYFGTLTQLGKPLWWFSLQLPAGELTQVWYYLHASGWAVLVFCLAMHLLMSAKVGGLPLILSMFDAAYRPEDSPAAWWKKIRSLVDPFNLKMNRNILLIVAEVLVMGGWLFAVVAPLLFS